MGRASGLGRRARVVAAVSLICALVAFAVAVLAAAGVRSESGALAGRLVPAASRAAALLDAYTIQITALREYVGNGRIDSLEPYREAEARIPGLVSELDRLVADHPDLSAQLSAATRTHERWLAEVARPQIANLTSGDIVAAQASQAAQATSPQSVALSQRLAVSRLQTGITGEMALTARSLSSLQKYLLASLLMTLAVLAVVVVGTLFAVRHWLLRPFAELRSAADAVAAGHHDVHMPAVGPTELAEMGRSMETMRIRLLDALTERESAERRFRGLLEAAPDATLGVGAEGVIRMVNAQAEGMFGYSRDELIGQRIEDLVPEASRGDHPSKREDYMADPRPRPMGLGRQLTARRRDGTEFPVEISLSTFGTGPDALVSAAVRDVSARLAEQAERERMLAEAERDRYERRLAQSQRLESLGQLVGGVAHDFNNILNVIMGYSAFVEREIRDAAGSDTRWTPVLADMGQVQEAADRAARLTHQLLAFARQEVVKPQVVDVNDVVTGVEQLLQRTLGEHVELVIHLHRNIWPVLADPGQLEQVLVNLAVNARDAMAVGGKLSVDTENVEVDGAYATAQPGLEPGQYVRLRVADTGTGMDRQTLERVFEPFFTTKPQGEGTGLGLATVYGIISQAGGHTSIYSEPGLGTTVTALLPVTEQQAPARPPVALVPSQRGQGETVLVVEDEVALRDLVVRILSSSGYQVLTVSDVSEALEQANALDQRIDLLLTDLVMPTMLGNELADRARALRPDLKVLFMSGYAQPVLGAQIALATDIELVQKPFTVDELLRQVRDALEPDADT